MQAAALRIARTNAGRQSVRWLATTTASPAHVADSSSATVTPIRSAPISLTNIEASWEAMPLEDKANVHSQLEILQKKDWKELSLEQKKAAYYVAFGPHGPRTPVSKPGDSLKIIAGVAIIVGIASAIHFTLRSFAPPPPRTINKEWQEAMNEHALEKNMNPITGISSENYVGKGFVTQK